ncbi:fused MFS/spermidine synthase [Brachybacterium sp. EF45031]|uniref:spermidine synthase n=1 Tax=Brachybacterium sillae TaxID=2810536 RepID=UPI00217E86AE|nr:fused MFS/spermidine synthase [Brachybacterium sillae]MCS6712178.1 fused MFS/spermidine synthase [Brachybacterium sillae]
MREASVRLHLSGQEARIVPHPHLGGYALEMGGLEQSHVDLTDPTQIHHEYLRRIATVLDDAFPAGQPLRVLHLGAGALTLARYLQATRPGCAQTVIEIERELPGFVTDHLPLPPGTDLTVIIGDARQELEHLVAQGWRVDAVIVDVFSGEATPEHLTTPSFHALTLQALGPGGAVLVNVGDDPPLRFFAQQARALEEATAEAVLEGPWTLTASTMLQLQQMGNLVLAAGDALAAGGPEAQILRRSQWLAAGPHPAAVLDPHETAQLVSRILTEH